jgi:CRISPR/Cas system-associated exonuclease Cas4 (RecB family)
MKYATVHAREIVEQYLLDADGIAYEGPRLHPCGCGHGQHAHTGAKATGKCRDCGCRKYRIDPAWHLAYQAVDAKNTSLYRALRDYDWAEREKRLVRKPKKPGEWSIGPSDAGRCRRVLWYRNTPPDDFPRDPDGNLILAPSNKRAALMGAIFHEEAVRRLKVQYPWRTFEQPIKVKGLDSEGRFDSYDGVMALLDDLKTAGKWKWEQINDFGAMLEDWEQESIYALALNEAGRPVRTLRLIYVNRETGHERPFERDYDQQFAEYARQKLIDVATALDLGQELDRDRSGPTNDPICAECPFRRHCWGMDDAEERGRSPESWTWHPDPVDEDVQWAIENNLAAKQAVKDAEQWADDSQVFIVGLEPRRYGDYKIRTQQTGNRPRYKEYADLLAAEMAKPEHERRDPTEIPIPRGEPGVSYVAARVSKSELEAEARRARKAAKLADQMPKTEPDPAATPAAPETTQTSAETSAETEGGAA